MKALIYTSSRVPNSEPVLEQAFKIEGGGILFNADGIAGVTGRSSVTVIRMLVLNFDSRMGRQDNVENERLKRQVAVLAVEDVLRRLNGRPYVAGMDGNIYSAFDGGEA